MLRYLGFCLLLILASCTIEKRHYTNGFHVEWNHQKNKEIASQNSKSPQITEHSSIDILDNVETTAHQDENYFEPTEQEKKSVDHHDNKIIKSESKIQLDCKEDLVNDTYQNENRHEHEPSFSIQRSISILRMTAPISYLGITNNEISSESHYATKSKSSKKNKGKIAGILAVSAWILLIIGSIMLAESGFSVAVLIISLLVNILGTTAFWMGVKNVKKAKKGKGKTGAIIGIILGGIIFVGVLIGALSVIA